MNISKTKSVLMLGWFWYVVVMSPAAHGEMRTIRVAYTDWFPYTYQENGKAAGFEIETFEAVMKTMNMKAEFSAYPFKRCLSHLEEGRTDALISFLKTPEREKYAYFPDTHISISKTVLFTTTDNPIAFDGSFESLKNHNIGVITGFSYGEGFDKAGYLKKDEARDTRNLIEKLLMGRHELAAENQAVVTASARKMGVKDKIRFLDPPIHTERLYVGFSKANNLKSLCGDFSKTLGEFEKTEAYKAILEKYGVKYSEMTEK